MTNTERKEGQTPEMFTLDSSIINRLKDQTLTGIIDPALSFESLEPGHIARNKLALDYSAGVGSMLAGSNLLEMFIIGANFTYQTICFTARERKIKMPTISEADTDAIAEIVFDIGGHLTSQASPISLDGIRNMSKRFSAVLSKPEEELTSAISDIVNRNAHGDRNEERLRFLESVAHFGACSIYFPMVAAQDRGKGAVGNISQEQLKALKFEEDLRQSLMSSDLTTKRRAHLVLEAANKHAHEIIPHLEAAYGKGDPEAVSDAWANAWTFINKVFKGELFKHKLQVVIEIDNTIRAYSEGIDPLSLPLDHVDPSIAKFYHEFQGTVPKAISKDHLAINPDAWADWDQDDGDDTPEAAS